MDFQAGQLMFAQPMQSAQRKMSGIVNFDVAQTSLIGRKQRVHQIVGQLSMSAKCLQKSVGKRRRKASTGQLDNHITSASSFRIDIVVISTVAVVVFVFQKRSIEQERGQTRAHRLDANRGQSGWIINHFLLILINNYIDII